jgi:hypothetical protein
LPSFAPHLVSRDLGDMISAKGDNIFMLKATYRFNI